MRLIAYQINGQTIGVDITTWYDNELNGNVAFKAIESNTPIPENYVEISSISNWDKFGGFTSLSVGDIKREINYLKPDNPTDEELAVYEDYEMVADENILVNGICELVDKYGWQNLNVVTPVPIIWSDKEMFDDNLFIHYNDSRIFVKKEGYYEISYNVNSRNEGNNRATTGVQFKHNGSKLITKTLSASYTRNTSNDDAHNSIPPCSIYLKENEYLEVVGFRLGDKKDVYTKAYASFVRIKYLGK